MSSSPIPQPPGKAADPVAAPRWRWPRLSARALLGSALLRKLLIVQLTLALLPFALIASVAVQSMRQAREAIVAESKDDSDAKSFEALRQRDVALAFDVATFLRERESDLRLLASLPRTPDAYAGFGEGARATLWTIGPDGKELSVDTPLYREIAFVDTSGHERVKATDVCSDYPFTCRVQPATDLVDVSNPANTLFE